MNEKLGVVYQQLSKLANRQQQNTDNGLLIAEKNNIIFEILHKLNPFDPIRDLATSDIMPISLSMFFSCPRDYYNGNKLKSNLILTK